MIVSNATILHFSRIEDARGNLTFIEQQNHVPFRIARVYWIHGVPEGEQRSEYAFRTQEECIIALSGSIDVYLDDGAAQQRVTLNRPDRGLYVPCMIWRRMERFSVNAVAYVLASCPYEADEHICNYQEYRQLAGEVRQ